MPIIEKRKVKLANEDIKKCDVVGPVEVRIKSQYTTCSARVLPGDSDILVGAILLEDGPARLPYLKIL